MENKEIENNFNAELSKYKSKKIPYNSEPEEIYSLKNIVTTSERCSGNTTRQVDYAIQLLFNGKTIKVESHDGGITSSKYLLKRIIKRLEDEFYMGQKLREYELVEIDSLVVKLRKIAKSLSSETYKI